jgi:hypothetical protein
MFNRFVFKCVGYSIAGLIACTFLPGCGSVDEGPHLYQFSSAVLEELPPSCIVAKDVDAHLQKVMNENFFGKHAFQHGNELKVQYQITFINEGSRGLRYLAGGFGAGRGKIMVLTKFLDGNGKEITSITMDGEVKGGWYGGSIYTAVEDCGDQIADYAIVNYLKASHGGSSASTQGQKPAGTPTRPTSTQR